MSSSSTSRRPVGLKTLRQLKRLRPTPVVIVLSHYELPPLREACLSAGADCFLEKTGAFECLRELLTSLAEASQGAVRQLARQFKPDRPLPMITDNTSNSPRHGFA